MQAVLYTLLTRPGAGGDGRRAAGVIPFHAGFAHRLDARFDGGALGVRQIRGKGTGGQHNGQKTEYDTMHHDQPPLFGKARIIATYPQRENARSVTIAYGALPAAPKRDTLRPAIGLPHSGLYPYLISKENAYEAVHL